MEQFRDRPHGRDILNKLLEFPFFKQLVFSNELILDDYFQGMPGEPGEGGVKGDPVSTLYL